MRKGTIITLLFALAVLLSGSAARACECDETINVLHFCNEGQTLAEIAAQVQAAEPSWSEQHIQDCLDAEIILGFVSHPDSESTTCSTEKYCLTITMQGGGQDSGQGGN